MRYIVENVDREHCLPGAPSEHDFAMVIDSEARDIHPISGAPQRKIVFRGSLRECHEWVAGRQP